MSEQDHFTNNSKKTYKTRTNQKKSYLEDLSPFYDEEKALKIYQNSKSSLNMSKKNIAKFVHNEPNVDDFKYTRDPLQTYSDNLMESFTNIDKYKEEDDLTDFYKDSENVSPNIQNSHNSKNSRKYENFENSQNSKKYENSQNSRKYEYSQNSYFEGKNGEKRILGTITSINSHSDSSKFKPYRPSFANLHGYSEKLKEISNILNSDNSRALQNLDQQSRQNSNFYRTPNRIVENRILPQNHLEKKSTKNFENFENRVENKENSGKYSYRRRERKLEETPKLSSSRRNRVEQEPEFAKVEEDEGDYSRTIRNVPQRELGETRRSRVTNFSRASYNGNSANNRDFKGFQDQEEKMRVFKKIKGEGEEICGSFISSYVQTINEDTLLEPDDYSKFLSQEALDAEKSQKKNFTEENFHDFSKENFSKKKYNGENDDTKDDEFKILSKFQKFDMSGSILKDFSKDFGRVENVKKASELGFSSKNNETFDSKIPTRESSNQNSDKNFPNEREEIRVTDLECDNFDNRGKNFKRDFRGNERNFRGNERNFRKKKVEKEEKVRSDDPEQSEFIGDTTLMELQ